MSSTLWEEQLAVQTNTCEKSFHYQLLLFRLIFPLITGTVQTMTHMDTEILKCWNLIKKQTNKRNHFHAAAGKQLCNKAQEQKSGLVLSYITLQT